MLIRTCQDNILCANYSFIQVVLPWMLRKMSPRSECFVSEFRVPMYLEELLAITLRSRGDIIAPGYHSTIDP